MANHRKTFFLSTSWDHPAPPLGPIKLGNIIKYVDQPDEPVYTASMSGTCTVQKPYSFRTKHLGSHQAGIWSRLLSVITGIGVDAGVTWGSSNDTDFTFESLSTLQFKATDGYLETCISAEPVKQYFEITRYKKPVYVITGLKIGRGTTAISTKAETITSELSAELDSSLFGGAPITVGPALRHSTEALEEVSWKNDKEFVFAYQLLEVHVHKTKKTPRGQPYTRGANLDVESPSEEETQLFITKGEPVVEEDEYVIAEFMDDSENIAWAFPLSLEDDHV